MRDKEYLLTYQTNIIVCGGHIATTTFSWFDTEEEMNEFIDTHNIQVIDALHILSTEQII